MQHENRMPRLLLLASTLAFAAGCSIVNDADDFVIDEGCNLDLTIERFIPHVRQRVEYRVVHEDGDGIVLDDGRVTPRLDALAVFEPLGFENGRLIMPGSVFPQTSTGLRAGGVDFWADVNRTMGFQFDPSSADHGWSLSDICRDLPRATANVPVSPFFADADEGSVFVHNVDFDDLIDPDGLPLGVEVEFEGLAGGLPDGVNVEVAMAVPRLAPEALPMVLEAPLIGGAFPLDERTLEATAVSMGNPHLVSFDDVGEERLVLGPALGADPRFPEGVNVGFGRMGPDAMTLHVFERGSGWTRACGTGACAAAVAAVETGRWARGRPLPIDLPGGRLVLTVGERDQPVRMRGPARRVFSGTVELPATSRSE